MSEEKLLWAVENGDSKEAEVLLSKIADIDVELKNGRNALHIAADYGQTKIVDLLIRRGANINKPDKYGITPLLAAIYEGHKETVEFLLEKKAKLGKAPDGTQYIDCASSDNLKELISKYM